jgi:hypothetical protein
LPQTFHIPGLNIRLLRAFEQENKMRINQLIFVGSLAALVAATAPVLAKNIQTQKPTDEQASSSSCHAYQQAPDGTWTALPCQEHGATAQMERKQPTTGTSDDAQR